MLNPFKYKPVSQRDDEDEEVLYHNERSIPLSNLGKSKSDDDEIEVELLRKPAISKPICSFPAIFVSAVSTIFVVLVIVLVVYLFTSSGFSFNNMKGNNTQSAPVSHPSAVAISSAFSIVLSTKSPAPGLPLTYTTTYETSSIPMSISSAQYEASTEVTSSKSAVTKGIVITTALLETNVIPTTLVDHSTGNLDDKPITPMVAVAPTNSIGFTQSLNIHSTKVSSVTVDIVATSSDITIQSTSENSLHAYTSVLPATSNLPEDPVPINWHNMELDVSSEATPVVIDVNNDGIDDIIYTYEHYTSSLDIYYCTSSKTYEEVCLRDTGQHVCGSTVLAVSGNDGEIIWLRNLTRPVFGVQCSIDVNNDKEIDCFIVGRYAQWEAIDRTTGETIWEVDKSTCFPGYNFYYPLPIKDFDGDGVTDIINIHGGDQTYKPNEKDRSPALIVVISGKTGKKLCNPIIVPDGHESYMSPVKFNFVDLKSNVVLFGTGGETIPGSLWAVTVDSIEELLKSNIAIAPIEADGCQNNFLFHVDNYRPNYDDTIYDFSNQVTDHNCPSYGHHPPIPNKYQLCLYELYKSESKGLIVPPVIIDMNGDTIQDILLQTFASHVVLLDGKNGQIKWERNIPYSESYNIPAPLFYNNDTTPDMFLRVNVGEWTDYNYSYVVIVDGENGEALWAMNSSYATMQSAVTLVSENHVQDAVLFFAYNPTNTGSIDGIKKRQTNSNHGDNIVPESDNTNDPVPADMFTKIGEAGLFDEDTNYTDDFDDFKLENVDEPFWNLSNSSFPDPIADPKGFIESCHFESNMLPLKLNTYLYFLTKYINDNGIDNSIAASYPGILIPGYGIVSSHSTIKRHEDSPPQMGPPKNDDISKHGWRCSYVLSPASVSPLTPVVTDLNHDGKLELIYAFQYTSDPTYFMYSLSHSVLDLHVQTIETMVPTDQGHLIDFSVFLPMEKQSWTTYMGTKGDGVYRYSN